MAKIVSEQNDMSAINWVAGMNDPGEMIGCGAYQQLRRQDGEQDVAYAQRLRPLMAALPQQDRDKIMSAAIKRANLDTSNGKIAVMVAGEPPWHGLGVNVESAVNSTEAIKLAGLDWKVEVWKSKAYTADGIEIEAPDARHIVRLGQETRVLGTVGTKYHPLQNEEAFAFMDSLVDDKLCMYETCGSLGGGEQVWMLAKIPKVYYAAPGDETQPYALLANWHNGLGAVKILPTTNRPVCGNTLNLSLNGESKALCIRHTASLKGKVEAAKKALGLISQRLDKYGEQMVALAGRPVMEGEAREFLEQFFPTQVRNGGVQVPAEEGSLLDSIIGGHGQRSGVIGELLEGHFAETERIARKNASILEVVMSNFEDDPARGTAWGLFNGITEYADHQASYRGKDKADARLQSAWFGGGNDLKQEALTAALQLVR